MVNIVLPVVMAQISTVVMFVEGTLPVFFL